MFLARAAFPPRGFFLCNPTSVNVAAQFDGDLPDRGPPARARSADQEVNETHSISWWRNTPANLLFIRRLRARMDYRSQPAFRVAEV